MLPRSSHSLGSTVPAAHAEVALAALDGGKTLAIDVPMERPAALGEEEARALTRSV